MKFFLAMLMMLVGSAQLRSQDPCCQEFYQAIDKIRSMAEESRHSAGYFQASMPALMTIHAFVHKASDGMDRVTSIVQNPAEPTLARIGLITLMANWRHAPHLVLLQNLAMTDPTMEVRQESVSALGGWGDPKSFDVLASLWATESQGVLRAKILLALGSIGNRHEWERIREALIQDFKRSHPGSSIDLDSFLLATGPLLTVAQETQLRSILLQSLGSVDYRIRMAAAEAARLRKSTPMADALTDQLLGSLEAGLVHSGQTPSLSHEVKLVKMAYLRALSVIGSASQEDRLVSFLKHEQDENVVVEALRTLGVIGTVTSDNAFATALFSANEFVSMNAALVIAKSQRTHFKPKILQKSTQVQDPYARQRMLEAADEL